jgi:hypothetical protein
MAYGVIHGEQNVKLNVLNVMYGLHSMVAKPLRDELRCSLIQGARIRFPVVEPTLPVAKKRLDGRTDDGCDETQLVITLAS